MSADAAVGTVAVTKLDDGGTWLIALQGEHDISTTPCLERQTSGVWPLCTVAVVDLSDAAFIDCSVINWLLRTAQALEATGHQASCVVEGPPSCFARRVLDIVCLRHVLACYPTREDALADAEHAHRVPSVRRSPSSEWSRRITHERLALRGLASSMS
jgi:anti-anti-sigma regulatory factor